MSRNLDRTIAFCAISSLILLVTAPTALAHAIVGRDAAFVQTAVGAQPAVYFYLGAKHMVTGVDHLAFLVGVVFYLNRLRDIAIYVSLFTLGHSLTLISGVLYGFAANGYLVDAGIALSVAYKALDNLGLLSSSRGAWIDARAATFAFGLIHGLGLSDKLLQLSPPPDQRLFNLLAFNAGVETGQLVGLSIALGILALWRTRRRFSSEAVYGNLTLLFAGCVMALVQLGEYFAHGGTH